MSSAIAVFEHLTSIIAARASASGDTSYTRKLLDGGAARITKKLGEEAVEVVIAAMQGDRDGLKGEIADLIYHLLVLMQSEGITLDEIGGVLEARFKQSGLEEKAARKQP